jgi:hypothetical protein
MVWQRQREKERPHLPEVIMPTAAHATHRGVVLLALLAVGQAKETRCARRPSPHSPCVSTRFLLARAPLDHTALQVLRDIQNRLSVSFRDMHVLVILKRYQYLNRGYAYPDVG